MKIRKFDKKKYVFKPYSEEYPKLFDKERTEILKVLPKRTKIEHVGSTSVPGLGGKGIIDIAIRTSKPKLKKSLLSLQKLGFEYHPDHPGNDRRWFMHKIINEKGKERRVHVHLCLTKEFWDSFITFRDYLRKNKRTRNVYAKIKKEGAKKAKGDAEEYRRHKSIFLKKIAERARERLLNSNI